MTEIKCYCGHTTTCDCVPLQKQTAVEWLENELKKIPFINPKEAFEQAKAIEKEQIIDAFVECWKENMPEGYECKQSAEYYYNETFKQD